MNRTVHRRARVRFPPVPDARYRADRGRVQTLSKLLPICAHCKRIRDDQQYWK